MNKKLLVLAVSALGASQAFAATEIELWHAMGGALGEKVDEIVAEFNGSQSDYVVNATYRGNYNDTMTGAIAAFRSGEQPEIVQVYEVGTATMMAAEGAIYPMYQMMDAVHAVQQLDAGALLQQSHVRRGWPARSRPAHLGRNG
mgnify:CR=1 FL=1